MTISEIYKTYRVNKGLQEHMVRVSACAHLICDAATIELDTRNIVTGCLLHDMANLIKAKMDKFTELFDPEGVEYWTKVQQEMRDQYGMDEHAAAVEIVKEINPGPEAMKYFNAFGHENTQRVHDTGSLGEKISTYCDMRVGIHNIISLQERMDDIRARYIGRNPDWTSEAVDERQRLVQNMEDEIFTNSKITPEAVNDETTKEIQERLYSWEV